MADGALHSLYVVEESTYGTTPNNPALDTVRITGTTLALNKDSLQSNEIRDDRQLADFRLGANQVGGDINFELSYGSFDQFLQAVLLSQNWAADTPVLGTQQLKAEKLRKYFTLVRYFSDIAGVDKPYHIFRGCELSSMTLDIPANGMVTGSFSIVGKSQEIATDLTGMGVPTFNAVSTTKPLDSFTGSLNENGTPIAVITAINMTLENGLSPRFVVGSKDTIFPSVARSLLTGSITAYFEDSSLVEKFVNETETDIDFTLPDAAGNQIKIIIPRIVFTGAPPNVENEGPVTLTMPFQALRDPTEGTNLLIERTPA